MSNETKCVAKHGERGREYQIVVLVNRNTASASEILSGALQDHDRAWIFGESVFGKGLVQAPFPLSGNSALLLTIAKYYTPSGRLIQRDYAHEGFYEYLSRNEGHNNLKDMKKTDSGRVVFGGDGITPDEKYKAPDPTPLEAKLDSQGRLAYFLFAPEFFAHHDTKLPKDWKPDDKNEAMAEFRAFIAKKGVTFTPAEFERDRPWIQERLREQLFITAYSKEESERMELQNDPEIHKAVETLPASKALLDKVHETVARQSKKTIAGAEARQ